MHTHTHTRASAQASKSAKKYEPKLIKEWKSRINRRSIQAEASNWCLNPSHYSKRYSFSPWTKVVLEPSQRVRPTHNPLHNNAWKYGESRMTALFTQINGCVRDRSAHTSRSTNVINEKTTICLAHTQLSRELHHFFLHVKSQSSSTYD